MLRLSRRHTVRIAVRHRAALAGACVVVLVATGCQQTPLAGRTASVLPPPAGFGVEGETPLAPAWFHFFENPELTALVERALAGNFDLRTGWARLEEADALARQARAGLWPAIEASVRAQRQRTAFRAPIFEGEQVFDQTLTPPRSAPPTRSISGGGSAARHGPPGSRPALRTKICRRWR